MTSRTSHIFFLYKGSRMRRRKLFLPLFAAAFIPFSVDAETLNVKDYIGVSERGAQIYAQICSSCHSPDNSLIGPAHRGVFGRNAGKVDKYKYSEALAASDITWTTDNLFEWLASPDDFVPGSKMYVSLEDPQQRADVIAYLKTLK